MLTYPWKCTVLHCNHLGNTWKPLVLMTRRFDYCLSASEGDNQSVRSSAPVVSRCFPGGYNVKLYISRGRLAWWLLTFLHSETLLLWGMLQYCLTTNTPRVQTSLAEADHFSHIAQCKYVEPWWWKANPKGSGSLPAPRSGHVTDVVVFFAHLLILKDIDHHQNVISFSLS